MAGVVGAASAAGALLGAAAGSTGRRCSGSGCTGGAHGTVRGLPRLHPGAVTAPLVVIPYSRWAVRRLRAAGVPIDGEAHRLPVSHCSRWLPRACTGWPAG
ncbi:hypothetical protein NKH18_10965 [Streptomyces sp. M10(2022)]